MTDLLDLAIGAKFFHIQAAIRATMAIKIEARCPNGHILSASLNGMTSALNLNIAGNIRLEGKCPICGAGPMQASSGYYEVDEVGLMKRISDCRP